MGSGGGVNIRHTRSGSGGKPGGRMSRMGRMGCHLNILLYTTVRNMIIGLFIIRRMIVIFSMWFIVLM